MKPSRHIERLIEIMPALRTPGTGCPWDLEQDFASSAPYPVEGAPDPAAPPAPPAPPARPPAR
eukprot:gene25404-32621_t